jgi:hypothetical protein
MEHDGIGYAVRYVDTDLPQRDLTIMRAFQLGKTLAESDHAFELAVRAAEIIDKPTGGDHHLITLALLHTARTDGHFWLIEKAFGADVSNAVMKFKVEDAGDHKNYKDMPPEIRQLTLAVGIARFEDYINESDIAQAREDEGEDIKPPQFGKDPEANYAIYSRIYEETRVAPVNEDLEGMFYYTMQDCRMFALYNAERLLERTSSAMPFDKQNLHDAPLVRRAYGMLADSFSKSGRAPDFLLAVHAGQLLSRMPKPNPYAISVGLIDIGITDRAERGKLSDTFNWYVAGVLGAHTVHQKYRRGHLARAPQTFQQVMAAYAATSLGRAEGEVSVDRGKGMSRSEKTACVRKYNALRRMAHNALHDLRGKTGAPLLEATLASKLVDFENALPQSLRPKKSPRR